MSYTALYNIKKDGTLEGAAEFRNAHGWCSFIWDALIRKYGLSEAREAAGWKPPEGAAMSFGPYADWEYLWHQHSEGEINLKPWEHNVLVTTYDNSFVQAEDFEVYARSLAMFHEAHTRPNRVDHTGAMAEAIRELNPEESMGLCFYPMSVSDDPWFEYDEEEDGSVQYDFINGTKHRLAEMKPFTL